MVAGASANGSDDRDVQMPRPGSIEALPDEVLERVLLYVGAAWLLLRGRRVCRRWARVCRSVPIRLVKNLGIPTPDSLPPMLERIVTCQNDAVVLPWVQGIARRFRVVAVWEWMFQSTAALDAFLALCPHLLVFGVPYGLENEVESVLKVVARRCHKLRRLVIRNEVADAALEVVAGGCPALAEVSLTDVGSSEAGASHGLTDRGIEALARGCPRLERFDAISVEPNAQVSDAALAALGEGCPGLQTLTLHNTPSVTDRGLKAIALRCQQLAVVQLTGIAAGDGGLVALARACPRLREVKLGALDGLTDAGVAALLAAAPRLQRFKAWECSQLTPKSHDVLKAWERAGSGRAFHAPLAREGL